ncbi:hypothetical protein [Acinetobacter rudis]|uniref:hypothetical protein n=1 Tax=Acinetobacter rudis TaxID=632955 RepID=UPI0033402932
MTDIKSRALVIKCHPKFKHQLILCDEQTGQPLNGQTSVVLESHSSKPPKVTVTFDAWGAHGVRFEDEPRQEQ